ncbi:MAG TPA: PhzF family phenazine biosynthesis isomerase [Haliscomenobacter sp.]|uniref:PhzF family phenazine biosynthesis protein n=1 Tax=Haliscomenobacter sp. TaxID=2717303 RepID=UPI002CD739E2|nr:PhzF family phenazine biosynthesis isomerase [Haliscomenobacter sp.]HOY16689.1 PhzF family phenazine biosynthesis isomerase [Haliscomenobacter sp.]
MIKTYFVDSFTSEPFKGNPAGVCLLEHDISPEKMLNIAAEIGFSETAFVKKTNSDGVYSIRYFSPKKEIPLCGHATLAAAKILFEKTPTGAISFITGENLNLTINKSDHNIVMEFPVYDVIPLATPLTVLHALGLEAVINTSYNPKTKIILLEIADSDTLAALKPDFNALTHSYENINGVLATAASNTAAYDFHYRYFWPWAGTNEDPVTGGVQTFLAKYWSSRLNKTKMKAFQSSQRTGYMTVELIGDKVLIYGTAVIVLEGNLIGD